ncbi:unnamed protein product [Bursaphelenchus okinawaensis]|uniref:Peroxiredoxin-like 2A n=1 Tax=Bursaphelenchus okinawaensis TaxID=465554 RepID=A0A811LCY7_9BILA|nr:unnamed protein product [Bursaphelenchus okinawaensis]CAG9120345.1 unnamed protein product [Bursaphelenchus okinawaensis]
MLGIVGAGAFAAAFGAVFYANLPTRYTLGHVIPTVKYLAQGNLRLVEKGKDILTAKPIQASEIFDKAPTLLAVIRRPGCQLCRHEAQQLSNLKDKLDKKGVQLVGVVHEFKGVDEFQPYLNGPVYYDDQKHFYGPNQRWLPHWMGLLRIGTYVNVYKTRDVKGNVKGEGRLLGGVYLIKDGEMVFAHLEKEWGDAADPKEIERAIEQL